jgi:hypothetical protein
MATWLATLALLGTPSAAAQSPDVVCSLSSDGLLCDVEGSPFGVSFRETIGLLPSEIPSSVSVAASEAGLDLDAAPSGGAFAIPPDTIRSIDEFSWSSLGPQCGPGNYEGLCRKKVIQFDEPLPWAQADYLCASIRSGHEETSLSPGRSLDCVLATLDTIWHNAHVGATVASTLPASVSLPALPTDATLDLTTGAQAWQSLRATATGTLGDVIPSEEIAAPGLPNPELPNLPALPEFAFSGEARLPSDGEAAEGSVVALDDGQSASAAIRDGIPSVPSSPGERRAPTMSLGPSAPVSYAGSSTAHGVSPVGDLVPLEAAIVLGLLGLSLLAAAFYHRIRPPAALDQALRASIHERLRQDGGVVATYLARDLGVNRTTVAHHLRTLERLGLARHVRRGRVAVWLPVGERDAPPYSRFSAEPARRLRDAIAAQPGVTLGRAALAAGLSKSHAHYHLQRLLASGEVVRELADRELQYRLAQPVQSRGESS